MKKFALIMSAAMLITLSACKPSYNNSSTRILMDTVVNISAEAEYSVVAEAMELCEAYEKLFSATLPESEISLLNKNGSYEVSADTLRLIKSANAYSASTNGMFDITIGAVSSLWDFSRGFIPEDSVVTEALATVGYKNISFSGNTVNLNGSVIDLGGCAKGFIADKIYDLLKERGVENAVINLGGNLYLMGDFADVGIKNPFEDGNIATLRVKNTSVVTAGTYERAFTANGKTYHHILNPKTGYPAETDLASVTVICESSLKADILSTSLVVMGFNAGIDFIEQIEDAEAVFVTTDGEVYISSGIYCKDGIYRL